MIILILLVIKEVCLQSLLEHYGASGSGKSFTTLYSCIYAISQGLKVILTSVMSRRSVHLSSIHIHKLFCLDTNNKYSPQRLAELAFIKCQRNSTKLNILQTVNIICFGYDFESYPK